MVDSHVGYCLCLVLGVDRFQRVQTVGFVNSSTHVLNHTRLVLAMRGTHSDKLSVTMIDRNEHAVWFVVSGLEVPI